MTALQRGGFTLSALLACFAHAGPQAIVQVALFRSGADFSKVVRNNSARDKSLSLNGLDALGQAQGALAGPLFRGAAEDCGTP
jgi:purine nucleoside permease